MIMNNKKVCLESINIIEWYDGVVRAIGKSGTENYLLVLIKWELAKNNRTYALFELDDNASSEFENCFAESSKETKENMWKQFETLFDSFISSYKGEIYLLESEKDLNTKVEYQLSIENSKSFVLSVNKYDFEKVLR